MTGQAVLPNQRPQNHLSVTQSIVGRREVKNITWQSPGRIHLQQKSSYLRDCRQRNVQHEDETAGHHRRDRHVGADRYVGSPRLAGSFFPAQ